MDECLVAVGDRAILQMASYRELSPHELLRGINEGAISRRLRRNSPTSTVIAPGFVARQHPI